jgi:hypothetical protein
MLNRTQDELFKKEKPLRIVRAAENAVERITVPLILFKILSAEVSVISRLVT